MQRFTCAATLYPCSAQDCRWAIHKTQPEVPTACCKLRAIKGASSTCQVHSTVRRSLLRKIPRAMETLVACSEGEICDWCKHQTNPQLERVWAWASMRSLNRTLFIKNETILLVKCLPVCRLSHWLIMCFLTSLEAPRAWSSSWGCFIMLSGDAF